MGLWVCRLIGIYLNISTMPLLKSSILHPAWGADYYTPQLLSQPHKAPLLALRSCDGLADDKYPSH